MPKALLSNGDVSEYGLAIGYVQTEHPQLHIKVSMKWNGCTYDVHVLDLVALVGQWAQYDTLKDARAGYRRAVRRYMDSDVSALDKTPPWK